MPSIYDIHQSRWLKVSDLLEDKVVVKIRRWGKEQVRHPETNRMEDLYFIEFEGLPKPFSLKSKGQCELIASLLGSDELDDWVGKSLVLGKVKEDHFGSTWHLVRVLNEKPPKAPVVGEKHADTLLNAIRDAGLTWDGFLAHLKRIDQRAHEAVLGKEIARVPAWVTREHLRTWIDGNKKPDEDPPPNAGRVRDEDIPF